MKSVSDTPIQTVSASAAAVMQVVQLARAPGEKLGLKIHTTPKRGITVIGLVEGSPRYHPLPVANHAL